MELHVCRPNHFHRQTLGNPAGTLRTCSTRSSAHLSEPKPSLRLSLQAQRSMGNVDCFANAFVRHVVNVYRAVDIDVDYLGSLHIAGLAADAHSEHRRFAGSDCSDGTSVWPRLCSVHSQLWFDWIQYSHRFAISDGKSKRHPFERPKSFTGVLFQMNEYVAHLLNYIFYEYVLSLLAILAWRGSYTLLDVFLYPENPDMSAGMCLCLGYPLYFLLMYTQAYSDKLRFLPSFVFLNYPSLVQNLRHLAAFFTCILLWRGFWLLFDTHIGAMSLALQSPYLFYFGWMFLSFLVLSFLKTASSINGPMSHMCDYYDLFPHYPNSYLAVLFRSTSDTDEVSSDSSKNTSLEPYSVAFLEWNKKKVVFVYRTWYFNRNISSRSCFSFESNCVFFLLTIGMSDKCGVCSFKTCFVFHGRKPAYRTNRGDIGLHGDMSRFSQTRIGSIINVANGSIVDRVI